MLQRVHIFLPRQERALRGDGRVLYEVEGGEVGYLPNWKLTMEMGN